MSLFALMPIEAFLDDRLSKTDLRVLGAIISFTDKKGMCWPRREQISERCGLPVKKISYSTSHLIELGWLKKEGNGGCSRSANYYVLKPNLAINETIVPESGTFIVPESGTFIVPDLVPNETIVPESGTFIVPESGTFIVPESGRGIKQTIEQTIEQTNITTTSAIVKKIKRDVNPKARITRDWQPSDRCYELIARAGIGREFASGLIDEFILYWEERGDKRSGWEATFINHAKSQWVRYPQKSQNDRQGSYSGLISKNNGADYDTNNRNFKASTSTGRKLSLVEQAAAATARVEARELREQKERVVN